MSGQAGIVARRQRRAPTVREVRLATGLVLFGYVLTHLIDHALGNVSVDAMSAGLDWAAWIWLGPVGLPILYGALLAHVALGLGALYGRRSLRFGLGEAMQFGLGLAIPVLLVNHIVSTRLAGTLFALGKGYPQELYSFWVAAPLLGVLQLVLLLTAWGHGCLGLYYWLRLKPAFPAVRGVLLAGAVLVPTLSVLGVAQGGRAIAALAQDPNWRAENLGPGAVGTPAQNATLAGIRTNLLLGYAGALVLVFAARAARGRRRRGLVALTYPDGRTVRIARGTSVLDASRLNAIPHASVCGGKGRCSTCRVRVVGEGAAHLAAPREAERAVLERIGARPNVRLACQIRPTRDLSVVPLLAPQVSARAAFDRPAAAGEERFVVAAFIDMRGSTSLAAAHLPFDTVFIINRFLTAVAGAVVAQGGTPNQFLGDGLLALFGITESPEAAARHALDAVGAVEAAVAGLNLVMTGELNRPIRFGMGLHAGTAVVGEIGEGAHAAFTAIGDPVNVASRLQDLTKTYGCTAVVSEAVYRAAGFEPVGEGRAVQVRGASTELPVRLIGMTEAVPLPA